MHEILCLHLVDTWCCFCHSVMLMLPISLACVVSLGGTWLWLLSLRNLGVIFFFFNVKIWIENSFTFLSENNSLKRLIWSLFCSVFLSCFISFLFVPRSVLYTVRSKRCYGLSMELGNQLLIFSISVLLFDLSCSFMKLYFFSSYLLNLN